MYKRELSRACGCASKADGRASKGEGRASKAEGCASKVEGRASKAEGRASKMARPDPKEPYLFCLFYAGNHDLSLLAALYIL